MRTGDLLMYRGWDNDYAIGLCLREEEDPLDAGVDRMLVIWFDDWNTPHENLINIEDQGLEVISSGYYE